VEFSDNHSIKTIQIDQMEAEDIAELRQPKKSKVQVYCILNLTVLSGQALKYSGVVFLTGLPLLQWPGRDLQYSWSISCLCSGQLMLAMPNIHRIFTHVQNG
jgi:hypothetical protein